MYISPMDSLFSLGFAFALTLILFLLVLRKTVKSWLNPNLPPGQNGWPIIGETLCFASCPKKFIQDRMIKHSPDIFQTSFGGEKLVVFCGASGNKFVYSNEAKFRSWLPRCVAKALSLVNTDSRSPSWRLFNEQIHKFFKLESMQKFVHVMDTKAREHLNKHWVPYNDVMVQPLSKEFGFSVACHLFLSCKGDAAMELAEPYYTLAERILSVPVNLPGMSYNRALKASKIVQGMLINLIKKRRSELLSKEENQVDDLLSRVIMALQEDFNYRYINDEELAGHLIALLFAGFSTTSAVIAFVLGHLAEYPDIYAKVLQEQLEIVKSKREGELLTMKDIEKMKYSWNVVCESMRLKPPAVGGFRETVTDISYAGFRVPKGCKVHWNVYSTHMDPTYFPNPEKFDPSRFDEKLPPRVYVPFGGGAHMCCGREFARIETLVYLHNVVTRFRLSKVNPNENIIYTPDPVAAEGLRIHLKPHAKLSFSED